MVPVTSDIDIYRTAKLLIDQHGDQTSSMIAAMIREFTEMDDAEAVAVWRRTGDAVLVLQAQEKIDGATVH